MFTVQENIDNLINKLTEEGHLYKEHITKIPDQESDYAKDELKNYENFEHELTDVNKKSEDEKNRLEALKIKAEQVSVDINLDELRKMQKDHDGELDEIDIMTKSAGELVDKLRTASGKKNLIREINSDLGKIKILTSKARGKQTHLGNKVDEC